MELGNLRLNLSALTPKNDEVKNEKVTETAKRKKKAKTAEPIEESWRRIFASKLSETDRQRLNEVKAAMDAGKLARNPSDCVNKAGNPKAFSKAEAMRLWKTLQEQQREETLRKMVENTPDNYWLITNEAQLNDFLALLADEEEIVFDVETTGTDVWNDYIVGHVLTAIKADIHAYIPTKHKTDHPQLDNDFVVEKLRPFYEDESIGKLAHNAKFDIHMLDREGITLRGLTWDTQEAMRLLNENEPSFALKNLVTKYLRIKSDTYEDLFGKIGFDEVSDLRIALAYAAKDGDVTRKLRDFQREHLKKFPDILRYYETVEVPLITVVQKLESTGFDIDLDFAEEYGKEIKSEIDRLYAEIIDELGDININSPAQLKPALEEATGEKLDSTDAKKVLKPLASKHPIIKKLLEYKEKFKLYSTYINALPELIDKRTGKLYTNFNQNGAKTGRFSSGGTGVNLQNQPKEARKMFVAPKGYAILGGDWSQQEYRCLAYFSQDPKLVDNYLQGNDLYASIASEVFNKPIEECGDGSVYRKQAKVIMLAVAYGGGANMLKDAIGISKKEAQKFLDNFFERFPVVKKWVESNQAFVKKHGYVWMDRGQRKRRLPDAKDRNAKGHYSAVYTQSTNARVQGSAAIQTKATMIALQELCDRKTAEGRGEWRIWCVVHDEALLLVPDTITREDVKDFEDVMLNTYVFGNIPNKTDIEICRRWGNGMKIDEFFTGKVLREEYGKESDYTRQLQVVSEGWQGS
ncbi:DNA polymerase I [Bacillus glycinifermentans]|uniref:DNA polymerase I n=1 Tax=Bacillus glycinifermentans TaxID=1664069 RepID=A0AAJ4D429_9BACI|nr:DNA polymerase [Bacillus glycinifermentans]QAT67140.1 DNA polymerase I [Bacillus glycinifermentans]